MAVDKRGEKAVKRGWWIGHVSRHLAGTSELGFAWKELKVERIDTRNLSF